MSRKPASKRVIAMPVTRRLRMLSGPFCQAADLILLGGAVLGVAYFEDKRGSLAEFLRLRVTLRNVFLFAMCLSTWRVILMSVGVYSRKPKRSTTDYLFRCAIALNSCTGVVGLIEVVLYPGRDVWHSVEVFWLVSLGLTGLLRIGLVQFENNSRSVNRL